MKKLTVICLTLCFVYQLKAQEVLAYDTIRKHELSLGVSPAIAVMLGAGDYSNRMNFNLSYKCYFKNNYVFRTSFAAFPIANPGFLRGLSEYDRTVNGVNVFRTYYTGNGIKTQLNLGGEKIYKINRLMHGIGAELGFNHQFLQWGEDYRSQPFRSNPNNSYSPADTANYSVDSLGYRSTATQIGIAVQVFYSVRYQIARRWYISATLGPSINFAYAKGNTYDRRKKENSSIDSFNLDFPNVPIISDISICFRL